MAQKKLESDGGKADEIWVSNPIGKDFQIETKHLPRVGDLLEIDGQEFKVHAVVYKPDDTDYDKVNKCSIKIVLENPPK
jgi:hypothetical protein